jgi:transcriptional regulator with XRE-family HTH domain
MAALRAAVEHTELSSRRKTYLRAVIHSAGLESMAGLAKKLGVPQSTLTNILSARRSASAELIEKIERLASHIEGGSILAAEALAREGGVNPEVSHGIGARLKEAHRERVQELQSSEEMTSKNIKEVIRNFDSMGSDDVFIFVSATESPFEMNPNETTLRLAILNAIRRNAFFIYLRPSTEHLERLDCHVNVESEFKKFKATLFSNLSEEERKSCAGHLVLVQAENFSLFVLPDFKWEIFYSDSIERPPNARALALAAASTDQSSSGAHVRVPLSDHSTKPVFLETVKAILQVKSGRRGDGKIPNRIIARLVESAEDATEQKIKSGP